MTLLHLLRPELRLRELRRSLRRAGGGSIPAEDWLASLRQDQKPLASGRGHAYAEVTVNASAGRCCV